MFGDPPSMFFPSLSVHVSFSSVSPAVRQNIQYGHSLTHAEILPSVLMFKHKL